MRKISTVCIAMSFMASIFAIEGFASETGSVYDNIMEQDYILVNDAYDELIASDSLSVSEKELIETLGDLLKCSGLYVDRADSGNVYTAKINVYLNKGTPYCNIEYDGYSGTIDDAEMLVIDSDNRESAVEIVSNNEEGTAYQFVSNPIGHFFSTDHEFTVEIGTEQVHILWGDKCEYVLTKATGAAEELAETKFVDSDTYQNIIDKIDASLSDMEYQCAYDENKKTLYVYLVLSERGRSKFINNADSMRDTWQTVVEEFTSYSETLGTLIDIATRSGLNDFSKGHCCIMIVDYLKDDQQYYAQDTWAIFEDGNIEYDLLADLGQENAAQQAVIANEDSSSKFYPYDTSATTGERNALQRAKEYLEYTAFSYTGLVEQLEYEGYSHNEAVYGADYCGADWKTQAAEKARDYLDYTAFSYNGLVEQLEYEGFTHEEAVYGADIAY